MTRITWRVIPFTIVWSLPFCALCPVVRVWNYSVPVSGGIFSPRPPYTENKPGEGEMRVTAVQKTLLREFLILYFTNAALIFLAQVFLY